jgi:hypothetical protein
MVKSIASAVLALTVCLGITLYASTDNRTSAEAVTVHEWGTFTSVAGPDGQVAQWLPLAGPSDLPCFVDYYRNRLFKSLAAAVLAAQKDSLDYFKARSQLLGPVRMETPVLYFYAERPQRVDVRVAFPRGFITEWFPKATVNQIVRKGILEKAGTTGANIAWANVEILPRNAAVSFPQGSARSHYYAARATDANPIRVQGQDEKFLFYRGVGGFPVPINVTVTDTGKIHIKHLLGKPSVILFENRGGKLGYRVVDTSENEILLEPPALDAGFESLRAELESVLVGQGLYPKEATAMVDTWRDSWFEEGTRLFYIVPPTMVDTILPLTIEPKPAQVARVFVGRVEVFTPATIQAVERAIATNDTAILATYGRFLGPITERIPESKRVNNLLDAAFKDYINQAASCAD